MCWRPWVEEGQGASSALRHGRNSLLTSTYELQGIWTACYSGNLDISRSRQRGSAVFTKGDKVVYPHHGAAVIEDLVEREVFGETRTYFKLRLAHGDLTLMVPVDNTQEVGLREVISKREVKRVFDVLREEEAQMPTNWSRRYKTNLAKLSSGDVYQVAEVVRNLSSR